MEVIINPNTEWGKMPRWKRRWSGFKTYTICAFYSLFCPEAVDYVVLNLIKDQFERKRVWANEKEKEGDLLVEDYPFFNDYSKIILIDYPYNRNVTGEVARVKNPDELRALLC